MMNIRLSVDTGRKMAMLPFDRLWIGVTEVYNRGPEKPATGGDTGVPRDGKLRSGRRDRRGLFPGMSRARRT